MKINKKLSFILAIALIIALIGTVNTAFAAPDQGGEAIAQEESAGDTAEGESAEGEAPAEGESEGESAAEEAVAEDAAPAEGESAEGESDGDSAAAEGESEGDSAAAEGEGESEGDSGDSSADEGPEPVEILSETTEFPEGVTLDADGYYGAPDGYCVIMVVDGNV